MHVPSRKACFRAGVPIALRNVDPQRPLSKTRSGSTAALIEEIACHVRVIARKRKAESLATEEKPLANEA
jgi:hypothetical protein